MRRCIECQCNNSGSGTAIQEKDVGIRFSPNNFSCNSAVRARIFFAAKHTLCKICELRTLFVKQLRKFVFYKSKE